MAESFIANPIYQQLANSICLSVLRGEISPGSKLPSLYEQARKTGLNANTVQRAYTEIVRMGIAISVRGKGTFVSADSDSIEELKFNFRKEKIEAFFMDMSNLGITHKGIVDDIKSYALTDCTIK